MITAENATRRAGAPVTPQTRRDTMTDPVVLEEATHHYPRFTLGPVSLTIARGQRYALLGRNGAGKTTLLSLLAGQLARDGGRAMLFGEDRRTPDPAVRERVAFVTSELLCCRWMTVRQHFDFVAQFHRSWQPERATSLARSMALDLAAPLEGLSRGNALKVALCAAWGQDADLLLLDEPTAGLDPVARLELLAQLDTYLSERPHVALLFATHVLEDLNDIGVTDLIVLRDGRPATASIHEAAPGETTSAFARRRLLGEAVS